METTIFDELHDAYTVSKWEVEEMEETGLFDKELIENLYYAVTDEYGYGRAEVAKEDIKTVEQAEYVIKYLCI